ncbi:MAG: hypothetical protein JHC93_02330 [Parachlamydiales bacterium]|nr:hypothetical protein [Parachlamydiales bacterium]
MHRVTNFIQNQKTAISKIHLPTKKVAAATNSSGLLQGRVVRLLKKDEVKLFVEAIAWAIIPLAILILATMTPYIFGAIHLTGAITLVIDLSLGIGGLFNSILFQKMRDCWKSAMQTRCLIKAFKKVNSEKVIDLETIQDLIPKISTRQIASLYSEMDFQQRQFTLGATTHTQADYLFTKLSDVEISQRKLGMSSALDYFKTVFKQDVKDLGTTDLEKYQQDFNKHLVALKHLIHWMRLLNDKHLDEAEKLDKKFNLIKEKLCFSHESKFARQRAKNWHVTATIKEVASCLHFANAQELLSSLDYYQLSYLMIERCGLANVQKLEESNFKSVSELKVAVILKSIEQLLGKEESILWIRKTHNIESLSTANVKEILQEATIYGLNKHFNTTYTTKVMKRKLADVHIKLSEVTDQGIRNGALIPEDWCHTLLDLKSCLSFIVLAKQLNVEDVFKELKKRGIRKWQAITRTEFSDINSGKLFA